MRLYYMQAACSLAPHIALREAQLPFSLVRFDKKTQLLEGGRSIAEVNDKEYVPVLELDDGERLTEATVILQYLADQKPEANLLPKPGTFERYRAHEWLNFIATEIHKAYWPLFHDGHEVENTKAREKLLRVYGWVEQKLGDRPFAFGDGFSAVDCYLFTCVNWARAGGIDLDRFPKLAAYRKRIRERPSVQAAFEAEGLIKR